MRLVETYSGFGSLELGEDTGIIAAFKEKGIKTVYCCGLATDYCVGSTAVDSAKYGYNTYMIMDASRSVAPETEEKMKARLNEAGVKQITVKDI